MNETQLFDWLRQQQAMLDSILATAGREFHDQHKLRKNFVFDLAECQYESFNLIKNADLCYDRPNTAFCYSLWYHARRVNTFLSHFAKAILTSNQPTLDFFDLGAGTGAVQWAIGLIYHKMKSEGLPVPKIRIINIDTSPFMLHYSKDLLWKHFLTEYPNCNDFSNDIEYEVNSWNNKKNMAISDPWITASYLFDISDTSDTGDYKKAVLSGFQEILKEYNPAKLLLLTSLSKEYLIDEVTRQFSTTEFTIEKIRNNSLVLSGGLPAVNSFRLELFQAYQQHLVTSEARSIRNPATWNDISFVGTIITKKQTEIFTENRRHEGMRLHNASIKVRRDVELNEEQKKAARNINQPSVIIGPAGCGKSIVITERIKNIVEEANYNPNLRILLTTFNKELLGQLSQWLSDILDKNRFRIEYDTNFHGYADRPCKIYFKGSPTPNIRLLHFDMLPKLIGGVPTWGKVNEDQHRTILSRIISAVKTKHGITDDRYDNILNADFLLEEYHRVIYGLQVGIKGAKEEYLTVSRKGRGNEPRLERNSDRRKLVWECLEQYGEHIYRQRVPSFTLRRQLFLSKLENRQVTTVYDYVVVDEFQDCTRADFEIFFHLLNDPNHLVISGDLAQAVHLGKSANIESLREAIREGRTMNDISWNYLEGSYRLPFRICEAVKRISEHINLSFRGNRAAGILTPYKGAPPGARPIVVFGKNETDVSVKISEIIKQYDKFELHQKCILEKDGLLAAQLRVDSDTVLRLKGLEKHCVIWSTRAAIEFRKEKFEFVYTILSRTSCILIIALFNNPDSPTGNTQDIFKEAIGLLRTDRIIFWDKETKDNFITFCLQVQSTAPDEDDS